MFFTNHYKEKLERLETEMAGFTAKLEFMAQIHSDLLNSHTALIQSFQKLQEQYSDGLERARQTIDKIQEEVPTFSSTPLYSTEEEEDLEAQLVNGLISDEDYREALDAAGLSPNISIQR